MVDGDFIEKAINRSVSKGFTLEKTYGKPGRTIISMNQGDLIKASDRNQEVITLGVAGCNVVAVEGTRDEKMFGAITHYDPWHIDLNDLKISELGAKVGPGKTEKGDQTNAEIFTPGDWELDEGKWKMKPKDIEQTTVLVNSVKKAFGQETNISITPYQEERKIVKTGSRPSMVSVDLSSSLKGRKRILGIF